jgi:hypothetical protein
MVNLYNVGFVSQTNRPLAFRWSKDWLGTRTGRFDEKNMDARHRV